MARRSPVQGGLPGSGYRPPMPPLPPMALRLSDVLAVDVDAVGAKAAALARATTLGLPVLPGAVLTTLGARRLHEAVPALRELWTEISDDGRLPVAVRSSSTIEDGTTSSMAGVFTSVLDVEGWLDVQEAIAAVLRSADEQPMAVLLQPMLDASLGGVLFGIDPVTGRTDRLLVETVRGRPAPLVGGLVLGTRHVLAPSGRLIESEQGTAAAPLRWTERRALASMARATAKAFGGPQDIEWAFDRAGRLWLLQSRPVTAAAARPVSGPTFGPGPVAETLPDVLAPLEEELWVEPLRTGIGDALRVVGVVSRRALRTSPIVVTVRGRVAADLDLLGIHPEPPSVLRRLDPRLPARRLGAAWRVGRLRRALPLIAARLVAEVDADLEAVPALASLSEPELVDLLHGTSAALHAVHGHEVLAGILGLDHGTSAAALALAAVAQGRAKGLTDAQIVAAEPVVLALTAPRIDPARATRQLPARQAERVGPDDLGPREALRLRARWLHELSARAAAELGVRLRARGQLDDAALVRWLRLDELGGAVAGRPVPPDLASRPTVDAPAPLPTTFRFTTDGSILANRSRRGRGERRLQGRGAGGGRAVGKVHDLRIGPPPSGAVLVVRTREPALAGALPGAAGLVSETGSILSHLAILARELSIATVVGVEDACERFPLGSTVLVDGATGEVSLVGMGSEP